MRYRNEKLVSGAGQRGEGRPTNPAWSDIRSRSIIEFVNRVSKELGAPLDRDLREQLYGAVFSNGIDPVVWRGATYTGPMLLDAWRRVMTEHR